MPTSRPDPRPAGDDGHGRRYADRATPVPHPGVGRRRPLVPARRAGALRADPALEGARRSARRGPVVAGSGRGRGAAGDGVGARRPQGRGRRDGLRGARPRLGDRAARGGVGVPAGGTRARHRQRHARPDRPPRGPVPRRSAPRAVGPRPRPVRALGRGRRGVGRGRHPARPGGRPARGAARRSSGRAGFSGRSGSSRSPTGRRSGSTRSGRRTSRSTRSRMELRVDVS